MSKAIYYFSVLFVTTVFFAACSKDSNSDPSNNTVTGNSQFRVRLSDAPADLDSVFVDIREVKIKMSDDTLSTDNWISMTTNAAIYNLLELQNGIDTTISTATIPFGTVQQIRLILGNNNRVVASGISYPLTIPSGSESGLKINLHKNVSTTLDSLIIDFNAALSVRRENDGTYKLRPVLQIR